MSQDVVTLVLLGTFLLLGLVAYERYRWRLGGVLVLPFLVMYSIGKPILLVVFAVSAAVTFLAGEFLHQRTLLYGRRLLVTHLVVALTASYATAFALGVAESSIIFPLLPGLFAFNLHREGRPIRGSLVFVGAGAFFALAGVMMIDILSPTVAMAAPGGMPNLGNAQDHVCAVLAGTPAAPKWFAATCE